MSSTSNTGFKTRQRPDAIRNSNVVEAKDNDEEMNFVLWMKY